MMDWRLFLTLLRKSRENQELRRSPARLRTSPAGFTGWEELVPTPPSCDFPFMVSKFAQSIPGAPQAFLGHTLIVGYGYSFNWVGALFYGGRPDQPSSSSLARRVCVQSSTSSSTLSSSTPWIP